MGWLASLTLEGEVRQDFDLPRIVCEVEDVFLDELLGLPPPGLRYALWIDQCTDNIHGSHE